MTSSRDSTSQDGFSLVEVIVTLSILAAISAFSLGAFTRTKGPSTPGALGGEVARMFQRARLQAITSRGTVEAVFDIADRRIALSGKGFVIRYPNVMQLRLETGQHLVESVERASIAFYADGSSSGGRVEFKMNGHPTSHVDVPWLTGIPRLRNMP